MESQSHLGRTLLLGVVLWSCFGASAEANCPQNAIDLVINRDHLISLNKEISSLLPRISHPEKREPSFELASTYGEFLKRLFAGRTEQEVRNFSAAMLDIKTKAPLLMNFEAISQLDPGIALNIFSLDASRRMLSTHLVDQPRMNVGYRFALAVQEAIQNPQMMKMAFQESPLYSSSEWPSTAMAVISNKIKTVQDASNFMNSSEASEFTNNLIPFMYTTQRRRIALFNNVFREKRVILEAVQSIEQLEGWTLYFIFPRLLSSIEMQNGESALYHFVRKLQETSKREIGFESLYVPE